MSSKFDRIFETRNETEEGESDYKEASTAKLFKQREANSAEKKEFSSTVADDNKQTPEKNEQEIKRGRPANGKKNNPGYVGLTTYIRKQTHTSVKIALLEEGQGRELSELVEELLAGWVKTK